MNDEKYSNARLFMASEMARQSSYRLEIHMKECPVCREHPFGMCKEAQAIICDVPNVRQN